MKLFALTQSFVDRALDRMVGKATAKAGCAPETTYRCVTDTIGLCPNSRSIKQACYFRPDCTWTCSNSGCCIAVDP